MFDDKTRRFAASSIFPSLFFAGFGVVLGQRWAMQAGGSWKLHLLLGLPGLVLTGLAMYRASLHWTAGHAANRARIARPRWQAHALDAASYLALLGLGMMTARLGSSGSVLSLGLLAILVYLIPWARVPACRAHFMMSSIVTLAGAAGWLILLGRPVNLLQFVVSAWIFSAPPIMTLLVVLASLDREYRLR
ncbi:hypothetical protein [Massilia terrae]|uniref:Uncharacterized protein n=1 Tax=Massilia terrae TaxID=1811224 RepID=A0ABT2CX06_9BURK|nr:hypothetical protein [Massilia terrae]MCS0658330.1 hypothetical protein [Massilia terrae]